MHSVIAVIYCAHFEIPRKLVVSGEAKPSQNLTNVSIHDIVVLLCKHACMVYLVQCGLATILFQVCVKGEDGAGHPFSFLREVCAIL